MSKAAREEKLRLKVGGKIYDGWTSVEVSRSIEQPAAGFGIEVADRWQTDHLRWPIKPGDFCEVSLSDDLVIKGWIDEANPGYGARDHMLGIVGRCQVGDLVDCSAIATPDEWSGLKLEEIAGILCQPFGVAVTAMTDTGAAFKPFKLQQGETVWEAIERMCRMRACLAVSDGVGTLCIIRAGTERAATDLKEGGNILGACGNYVWTDRFKDYLVKGQQPSTDGVEAEAARSPSGGATDKQITRYRPLLILAEGAASGQSPQERAEWEATVRAGKAVRLTVTVQGWRMTDGRLWPLNQLVNVVSPMLGISEVLLICGVKYNLDDQGSRTEMALTHPDAYKLLPEVQQGKSDTASGLPDGVTEITLKDFNNGRAQTHPLGQ